MKLYVDLDSTLTDFDRQLAKILGEPVKKDWGNNPRVWSAIDRAGTKFWSTMRWLPGSDRLWDELKKFEPTILSSPSRHQSSIDGKKEWLRDNLPGVPFIIEQEKEKYAAPDAILVDDREKNIKKWEEKGGIGILHKSVPETLIKLADAIQNLDKNIKKAADKGYVKFYKDSSNPKGLYALANDTVFSVNANKGYPLFEASKTKLDDFRGSVQEGKYLEIPFSRVIDYPTEGEGTTSTPYCASDHSNIKMHMIAPDAPGWENRELPICDECVKGTHISFINDHRGPNKDKPTLDYDEDATPGRRGCKNTGRVDGKLLQCACNPDAEFYPGLQKAIKKYKSSLAPYTASSKYKIEWKKPDVSKEADEYFNNAVTSAALLKEKVKFNNPKEFEEKFKKGKVEDLPVTGF